jgi:hypothetical protein
MNLRVLSTLCCLSLCLATFPALADEDVSGVSVGLGSGFGLPVGWLMGGGGDADAPPLNSWVFGIIPAQLDLGWFLSPRVYLGTSFQYSHVLLAHGCAQPSPGDCEKRHLRLGVTLSYHVPISSTRSHWMGLGTGYEYLKPGIRSFKGVELVNLQGGTDFRVSEKLWLGPFVTFAVGKYLDVDDARFHGWLMGGLRISIRQVKKKP